MTPHSFLPGILLHFYHNRFAAGKQWAISQNNEIFSPPTTASLVGARIHAPAEQPPAQ
jgi:hypothetical protein